MEIEQEAFRVRLPQKGEVIGEILEVLGASRFKIACADGHTRICRIPGRFRKMIKVRAGDYTIVQPWDIQSEEKGDVVYIYTRTQVGWLRKKGVIK